MALALLWLNPDDTVRRIRKEGLLRASRYGYSDECIRKIAEAALSLADELPLSNERRAYLSSVLALTRMAGGAKQLYRSIVDRLRARQQAGIKTFMAMVNAAFSVDYPGDRMSNSDSLEYWDATEQASAFSRLYTIARDELGIKAWTHVDDSAIEKCQSSKATHCRMSSKLRADAILALRTRSSSASGFLRTNTDLNNACRSAAGASRLR